MASENVALSNDLPAVLVLTKGVKTTIHLPVAPAAMLLEPPAATEKSLAFAPLKLVPETVIAVVPPLTSVTVLFAALTDDEDVRSTVSGSCSELGVSATPVPPRFAKGAPPLPAIEKIAVSLAAARGEKVMPTLLLVPAAIESGLAEEGSVAGEVIAKSDADALEIASAVTLSGALPLLLITSVEAALVLPTAVVAKMPATTLATG